MTTYPTPHPIDLLLQVAVGEIRITASDRDDTVVIVRPTNPSSSADVSAADQVRVDHVDGRVEIKTAKSWKLKLIGPSGSVDVIVDVPSGSRVDGNLAMGAYRVDGELGASRFRTGMGDVRLDQVGALQVKTGYGDIEVDIVCGSADIATGSGRIRVGTIEGDATIRNSNGATDIASALTDLRVKSSNGDIGVGRADRSATLTTANGRIRIGEVRSGSIVAETAVGSVDIGVRSGTAAWLDLASQSGDVRNGLDAADAPVAPADTVEVRARTAHGAITITRVARPTGHHEPTDPSTESKTTP